MHWHPLRLAPIYKERVWGGRQLASLFGRPLPGDASIGESWEIADRPGDVSHVAEGPLAGRTLAELMAEDAAGLLGDAASRAGRFPLLVKILDARDNLSVQVHPPAARAAALGGEPKTELWYFVAAEPGARVFAGLRPGITRISFEQAIREGTVADTIHELGVRAGDALYLPSGRVHALGAGLLLFEIQENSDTTYRVFDWNRVGLDGRPRALHVTESLASIDFSDTGPELVGGGWQGADFGEIRTLVDSLLFRVEARRAKAGAAGGEAIARCRILGVVHGELQVTDTRWPIRLRAGDFCLIPGALGRLEWKTTTGAEWLVAEPGPAAPASESAARPTSRT